MLGMDHANHEPDSPGSRLTGTDAVLIGLVLIATAAVLGKDISVGGLRWGDTSVHAMDGVLIHDWIAAGTEAWRQPIAFAEEQYAHYPCLGIGRHYPPGFALVEAGFFAVFGISAFTARLCVVFFGLLAAGGLYVFLRSISDRPTSLLGTAVLITMPAVTLWGRQAMLEVPTMAVLAWGAVALSWYLRKPSWGRYGILLAVATLAILFRQTGVFLHSAIALTLAYGALRRTVRWSHCLCSMVLALVAIALVTVSFEGAAERMLRGRASYPSLWEIGALTFYLRKLPEQVGLPVLIAAVAGIVIWPRKHRTHWIFMLCWFFVCYVMLSAAELKWTRFFFVGLLPFSVWAAVAAGRVLSLVPSERLRIAVAAGAAVALGAVGLAQPVKHHPDYGSVVAAHRDKIEGGVVLASGLRDTHFVWAVRQHIPWRKAAVIRGSKLLYVCNTVSTVDFVPLVETPEEVADVMRRFAFTYVFTERENKHWIPQDRLLNKYLAEGDQYDRVASHPLPAESRPTYRDTTIDVYELAHPLKRTVDHFDILIPRSNRSVRIDLDKWSS